MKRNLIVLFFGMTFGSYAFAQSDNSQNRELKSFKIYGGLGGGFGYKGGIMGISSTFILKNDWGGSVSYKNNFFKAENMPDNYDAGVSLAPALPLIDYLQITSMQLLKEFSTANKKLRFGIEGGPSWVNYNSTNFIAHSSGYFSSNYETSHTIENTVGLSLRAKAEFPFSKYFGIECAGFANLNKFKSFVGIELYLTFGLVRN